MKITGGDWCGQKFQRPKTELVRPTTNRVRECIFGIINSLRIKQGETPDCAQWHCLDFFAGSGALGFEALSRNAKHCTFVENSQKSLDTIQKNVTHFRCDDRVTIMAKHIWAAFPQLKKSFPVDLVLADPPYEYPHWDKFLQLVDSASFLSPKAILVLEHDPQQEIAPPPSFSLHSHRTQGPAGISVFQKN